MKCRLTWACMLAITMFTLTSCSPSETLKSFPNPDITTSPPQTTASLTPSTTTQLPTSQPPQTTTQSPVTTQTTYIVTFNLGSHGIGVGNLVQAINSGATAIAPTVTANAGWTFRGWDKPFSNVTSNLTVNALYSQNPIPQISSVKLKILANDTTALIFGFDFFDTNGQQVTFSGVDNARFGGGIWQGHLSSPISYVINIDVHIGSSSDIVTIPYSALNFNGIDKSQPVNVDLFIRGLFTNVPDHINLDNYWFQLIGNPSVVYNGVLIQLPASIDGKR